MENNNLLETAIDAVRKACRVTRKVQEGLAQIRQFQKDDKSPVTVADFASQAVVCHVLQESLGSFNLVGEETSQALRQDDQERLCLSVVEAVKTVWPEATREHVLNAIDLGDHAATAPTYWTLDPVDGTKGFLRGEQYAISLALIEKGRVVLGVLGCPNLSADLSRPFFDPDLEGRIFYAVSGEGTHSVSAVQKDDNAVRLSPPVPGEHIRVCESVEPTHSKHDDTAKIVEILGGAGKPVRLDSQCKYAVVARGQADAYLRLPTRKGYVEKIWDHAAGMLIAQEAGIVVTDIHGQTLDFSIGVGLDNNQGIVCAHPKFHNRIIEAIRKLSIGV